MSVIYFTQLCLMKQEQTAIRYTLLFRQTKWGKTISHLNFFLMYAREEDVETAIKTALKSTNLPYSKLIMIGIVLKNN